MINMREVFAHKDYTSTIEKFKLSNCSWSIFQELHKDISNNKCPICEVELDTKKNSLHSSTIDHFRPKAKDMYPGLKCEPRNYILMCNLCNERYKKSKFPLLDESKRAINAKKMDDVIDEEPLLFNPTEEDPLHFFELAFRRTHQGGILELKRNSKTIPKDKNSYEYKRCKEMIELFGLGYCHKDIHPTKEVKKCRVDILTKHYSLFIDIVKAINDNNKKSLAIIYKNKTHIDELKKYGFYKFIINKQFTIK